MNIALISGTSGLVGMQLLHQLLKQNSYDYIISVGRRKLALKHANLVQLAGNMSQIQNWNWEDQINSQSLGGEYVSLTQAIQEKKCTIQAFSSLGTTIKQAGSKEKFFEIDHDLVLAFAKWAKSLGANGFYYVSALGADPQSSVFYNEVKGKTEEDLKALDFEHL
ncbi:NAD-dependent epimerase/dehydratase family protein, partial [uncultured Algoriphagus sp.]|nr:NAD-dependent epimerase [Algoriphagus sp.]